MACEISVVVPVYRCTPSLQPLVERLRTTLEGVVSDWEVIFVDDGGGEGAWEAIDDLAGRDPRVRGVALSRNFGQHAAITAGINESTGRWVAVIDCDLQEPPEVIAELYARAEQGFDIVYTLRRRKTLSLVRRALGRLYFWVLRITTGAALPPSRGTLSLISRKVADAFLELRERDRHYLAILAWLGFNWAEVEYEQEQRTQGRSSYGWRVLLRHAVSGLFFQTTKLLRWVLYAGFVIALAGFAIAVFLVISRLRRIAYPGWTSLAVFTLGVGGVTIIAVGLVGLYVSRIFEEIRRRPLYVVDRRLRGEAMKPGRSPVPEQPEGLSGRPSSTV